MSVSPHDTVLTVPILTQISRPFTVKNTGTEAAVYSLTFSCVGPLTACFITSTHPMFSGTSITLNPGESATILGWGTTGSVSWTSDAFTLIARDNADPNITDQGVARLHPLGAMVLPENQATSDATAFSGQAAYSTPAYFSLDEPRALTVQYASSQAVPRILLRTHVVLDPSSAPSALSILVKDSAGTVVAPETFYSAAAGENLLSVLLDTRSVPTGRPLYFVTLRAWWAQTSEEAAPLPVRLLVVNESASPFGAGWSMPGLLRVTPVTGGVVLTGGDGSAAFHAGSCSAPCSYVPPLGVFDTLKRTTTGYTLQDLAGTVATFDAAGLLVSTADRFGNAASYTYTAGLLTGITDPAGKTITLGYTNGKLASVTDPGGRTTGFSVQGNRLMQIIEPDNNTVLTLGYDPAVPERLTSYADRAGNTVTLTYDAWGFLASAIAPQVMADGSLQRPTSRTESLALTVVPAAGTGTAAAPAARIATTQVWISSFDPKNNRTRVLLDTFGVAIRTETPTDTGVVRYDSLTRQVRMTVGPPHDTVYYTWSGPRLLEQYRMVQATNGTSVKGWFQAYGYNKPDCSRYNQPDSIYGTVPSVTQECGSRGEVLRTVVSIRDTTTYLYDARGRVTSSTNQVKEVSRAYYASGGFQNADSTEAPGPRRSRFVYDGFGRAVTTTDPIGRTSTTVYDELNRVRKVIGPASDTTTFTYAPTYRSGVTDALGQSYRVFANALNRDTASDDPRGRRMRSTYDILSAVRVIQNRRCQTIQFTYDQYGRVTRRVAGGDITTYDYDPQKKWFTVSNAESTDTLYNDPQGRVTNAVSWRAGRRLTVSRNYWASGNLMSVATGPGSGDLTTSYSYDSEQSLQSMRWGNDVGPSASVDYDARHRLSSLTYKNCPSCQALTTTFTYTNLSGIASVRYGVPALDAAFGMKYHYDGVGRIDERRYAAAMDTVRRFSYDALGQLATALDSKDTIGTCGTTPDGETCTYTYPTMLAARSYAWDRVGNPADPGSVVETGNRLKQYDGFTLEYDEDGNLARKYKAGVTDQRLYWNALGQLDSITGTPQGTVRYGYDGFGRRIRRTVTVSGADVTVRYVFDGANLLYETDAAGNYLRRYTYLPDAVDAPVALIDGNSLNPPTYFYAPDGIGHVRGLFDGSGNVVNQYRYGPWGASDLKQEAVPNPLQFMARELDSAAGLYYVRARWYDPELKRFISEDPAGIQATINLYAYAENDPINRRDPTGMISCSAFSREDMQATIDRILSGQLPPGVVCGSPPGDSIEVMFWHPVGKGASSFGHVSVNVNGVTYTFGPGMTKLEKLGTAVYMERNTFREGFGLVLDLSPEQAQKVVSSLEAWDAPYSHLLLPFRNCGDPIESALEAAGVKLGMNVYPGGVADAIMDANIVKRVNWYPANKPAQGWNAPWTRW